MSRRQGPFSGRRRGVEGEGVRCWKDELPIFLPKIAASFRGGGREKPEDFKWSPPLLGRRSISVHGPNACF